MAKKSKNTSQVLTTTIEPVFSPKKKSSAKQDKVVRKTKKKIKECLSKVKRVAKNDKTRVSRKRSLNMSSSSVSSQSLQNLWDKAINKNHQLEEWIDEYNEQMEKVDETELSIISE